MKMLEEYLPISQPANHQRPLEILMPLQLLTTLIVIREITATEERQRLLRGSILPEVLMTVGILSLMGIPFILKLVVTVPALAHGLSAILIMARLLRSHTGQQSRLMILGEAEMLSLMIVF